MPVCAACGTENPDVARFCLACGSPLAPPAPPEEERKPVTAIFVDLVGSTSRGEQLDPEDVLGLLEPYYARLRGELERFGGTVEKYIGDAVVAVFGAPLAHEDDPERAVCAGLAILDAIGKLNEEDPSRDLHVRIGIATGEAIVSLAARAGEGKGLAWGDVLNTAARLQSAAPVNGILVGEETHRATAASIEYRPHEPVTAKGKAEPVAVWQPVARREQPAPRRAPAPLVGRGRELEQLLALWERTREDGRPGLAILLGPPGIGKSRLLLEVIGAVEAGATIRWGRCVSYGEGITYWPIVQVLREAAEIQQGDDAAVVSEKLAAMIERLPMQDADQLRTIAAALATLFATPTTPRGTYAVDEISQAELHWGLRRLFELGAAERPLVLVLEDLHWAEPTLLELIEYLLESDAPLLLLASSRPELRDARPQLLAGDERRLVLELEALDEAQSEALLSELLAEQGLVPADRMDALLRNAGGNPLFLEETVWMLIESGMLDEGGRRLAGGIEALPVPSTLQALIGSRLDALPGDEKRLAQHASVVGTIFWTGAVAHLQESGAVLEPRLESLERREVVRANERSSVAGEREWSFKHIVLRDVAYGRLPKGRRASLHVRFADWLSLLPGEDEFVEIVAYHLEQACRLAGETGRTTIAPPISQAVEMLARAAEKAERREGIREADRYYARALELVEDEQSGTALELRLRRGRLLMIVGGLRRASEVLEAVADDAQAVERLDLRCAALITLANIDSKQGRPVEARVRLVEAAALAAEASDLRLRATAAFESAKLHAWFDGNPEDAIRELHEGLALVEELDDRALRVEGHMRLGTVYVNWGRLAEAEEQYGLARGLAGGTGSYRDEARATSLLSALPYYRGDIAEGERLALQALDWLERTGDSYLHLQTLRRLARYALVRGEPTLAEARLREALPAALESGGWLVVETYRYLVEALVAQRRIAEARELCDLARRDAPRDDEYAQAALRVAEAFVAEAEGDAESAVGRFGEAVRLLTDQQMAVDLAETRLAFARVLRRLGRADEARAQLALARETFERAGAPNLVAQIDREVAELARGPGKPGPLEAASP